MKKQYVAILAISLAIGISPVYDVSAEGNDDKDLKSKQQVSSDKKDLKDESGRAGGDYYLDAGFDLMENENIGYLKSGLTGTKVNAFLGEPEEKSRQEVWGADGEEHQTWSYKTQGIELDMMGAENQQEISGITISDPCALKTGRNIGLGSSREEVLKAYKNEIDPDKSNPETFTGPDTLIAGTIYGGIFFKFKSDRVSSIFVGAGAE